MLQVRHVLTLLGALLLHFAPAQADSTFVGGGNIAGSWDSTGSPYVVQGNLNVLASDSLLIAAGTKVYFAGAFSLSISGYIGVAGAETDSVVFTTDTLLNPDKWRGLSFVNAHDSSFVEYAIFEHARSIGPLSADSLGGAIYASAGTTLRVEHSTFRANYSGVAGGGVYFTGSTLLMDSCLFHDNFTGKDGGGLFLNNSVNCIVKNSHLTKNQAAGNGGGIYIRGTTPSLVACLVDSNFATINGGGIALKNSFAGLDSCTIRANVSNTHGGGMSLEQSNPEIRDCLIEANQTNTFDGGGVYIWESSPHMLRCRVLNNVSADDGGGIHSYRETSDGIFEQCEIRGNTATGEGGGIWVTLDGSPIFTDCIVRQNSAETYGGGVFLRSNALPVFTNCEIDSNTAALQGGGMSIRQAVPSIVDCKLRGNSAVNEGGGMNLWEVAVVTMSGSEISGNSSGLSGGGIAVNQSDLHAVNCIIAKNSSGTSGGGVATSNAGYVELEHCTIAANGGGGLRIESSATDVQNCVIAHSINGSGVYFDAAQKARITYSTIAGSITFAGGNPAAGPPWIGIPVTVNGQGDSCDTYFNLFSDPLFADSASNDWQLSSGSNSIGAGNWNKVAVDYLGNPRPQPSGTLPDMGALESTEGDVPSGAFGLISGELGPDTVKIVADVQIDSNATLTFEAGTTALFCGPSCMYVLGSLQVQGTIADSIRFTTDTLSNPGRWRGVQMSGNSSESEFEYFELSDARALVGSRIDGGGLHLDAVSPTFSHASFKRLSALRGGGVFCQGTSAASFTECDFVNCSGDSGGIFHSRSGASPTLDKCRLIGGTAHAGGAWLSESSTGTIQNSRIEGNSAVSAGGGMFFSSSPMVLTNNLILNNTSMDDGGGVWINGSTAQLSFNTISGNSAVDGAGVFLRFGSSQLRNNIIAENHGDGIYFQTTAASVVRYNCVADNDSGNFVKFADSPFQAPSGIGVLDSLNANGDPCDKYYNIVLNPIWVSGVGSDYYLSNVAAGDPVNSPCLNAGDSLTLAPSGTTRTDFIGDSGVPDQGYHAPQLAGPPPAVSDLVIRASADSISLFWSYDGTGLFHVKTDSSSTGSFLSTVAITADTFIVLPYVAPLHPTKGFFEVVVEPLP